MSDHGHHLDDGWCMCSCESCIDQSGCICESCTCRDAYPKKGEK